MKLAAARPPVALRLLLSALLACAALLLGARAEAYPWMIRHEYVGCGMCHADPTGGGVLTPYGRAQGDLLLRMHYGQMTEEEAAEPSKAARFAGFLEEPDGLMAGGSVRSLFLANKAEGSDLTTRFVQMQADLRAAVHVKHLVVDGSLGYVHDGALKAAVTSNEKDNLVAREYWAGLSLKDDAVLVRAGRMNLPFGIRNIDHTLWARTATRTDINADQQHGVAFAYVGEAWRGELMGVLGNFQVRPDDYRDRGGVGYIEHTLSPKYTLGLSGLFLTSLLDIQSQQTQQRLAVGPLMRAVPWKPLVLSAEMNFLARMPVAATNKYGVAGYVQGDLEAKQGLHLFGTAEVLKDGDNRTSLGGWAGVGWFFLPHLDLRVDGILRSVGGRDANTMSSSLLVQAHAFL